MAAPCDSSTVSAQCAARRSVRGATATPPRAVLPPHRVHPLRVLRLPRIRHNLRGSAAHRLLGRPRPRIHHAAETRIWRSRSHPAPQPVRLPSCHRHKCRPQPLTLPRPTPFGPRWTVDCLPPTCNAPACPFPHVCTLPQCSRRWAGCGGGRWAGKAPHLPQEWGC